MKRFFILFAVIAGFCCAANAQIPSVTLKDINGKTIKTDTINNGGKPFIIDFFALWCKPCMRELTAIGDVYEEWQEETGVKLVAVSVDEGQNAQKVKPQVDNHGWSYEVLLDSNGELRRAFGIQNIPYTVICDGEGNIVYKHSGYVDGAEEELIEKVRELLKQ